MRHPVLRAALAATTTLAMWGGLVGCSAGSESDDAVRILGTAPSMNTGLPLVMATLGTGPDHDLELTYDTVGASSATVIAGVMSGEAQFGVTALTPAIEARHNGAPLQIIAGTGEIASLMVAAPKYATAAKGTVDERLKGLKGATIGTGPVGSTNHTALRAELSRVGLDPDGDVKLVGVSEPTALVSGLKQGQFDAAFYGAGALEQSLADGEGIAYLTGEDLPTLQGMAGIGVVAREDYIAKNSDAVDKLREALVAAAEEVDDDPEGTGEQVRKKYFAESSEAAWKITWELGRSAEIKNAMISPEGFQMNLDLIRESGSEADVTYEDAVASVARGDVQ